MSDASSVGASASERFLVLTRMIVGSSLAGLRIETYWDGTFHGDREAAIKAGFRECESDDFNVGVVRGGRLVSIDWMHEPLNESAEHLAETEDEIGLFTPTPEA